MPGWATWNAGISQKAGHADAEAQAAAAPISLCATRTIVDGKCRQEIGGEIEKKGRVREGEGEEEGEEEGDRECVWKEAVVSCRDRYR